MAKISYMTVGSNRLEEAKAFYDALLGSIGMRPLFEHPSGGRLYRGKGVGMFGVLGPYDGNPACIGNGMMGGFDFETREEVDAFAARSFERALAARADGFFDDEIVAASCVTGAPAAADVASEEQA